MKHMKKQDIFLATYIAFIIVCVVVYQFKEYSMWNSMVSAVSFSSIFLAYADVFMVISKGMSEICDTSISHIMKKRLRTEEKALEEISNLISSVPKDVFNVSEMERAFNEMLKKHDELKGAFENSNTQYKRLSQNANRAGCISNAMYFFGFFSFLCIMSFYPNSDIANEVQTIVSVLAFAIVLSTQICDSFFATLIDRGKKRAEDMNSVFDKKIEELENVKHKVRDFVESINN